MAIKKKKKAMKPKDPKSSSSSSYSMSSSHRQLLLLLIFPLLIFVCFVTVYIISFNSNNNNNIMLPSSSSASLCTIEIVNEFPHDPHAFTQGLLYAGNDTLFESTGLYGRSSVRKVDLQTGKVLDLQKMDDSYFGEGLTLLGERLFQVAWLTKTGFEYDRNNLSKFKKFTHQMKDGWGLATDGKILFGSDGTSVLYQINPITLKVIEKHIVKYNDREVRYINELEYVNGEVWANVWQTDCIARISPQNGIVLGWILLPDLRKGLMANGHRGIDVLNGIALDSENHRIFVTGKLWPKLYEIKLHPVKKHLEDGVIERNCIP
ncbi:hypothetical protein ACFE04_004389 [Oxalis oulophora]